jgi:hypothetical protein
MIIPRFKKQMVINLVDYLCSRFGCDVSVLGSLLHAGHKEVNELLKTLRLSSEEEAFVGFVRLSREDSTYTLDRFRIVPLCFIYSLKYPNLLCAMISDDTYDVKYMPLEMLFVNE